MASLPVVVEVSDANQVTIAYERLVDRDIQRGDYENAARPIKFQIQVDVSRMEYREIKARITAEAEARYRTQDYIENQRPYPYDKPVKVVVENVDDVNEAANEHGIKFYCCVPEDVPEETVYEIIVAASQLGVIVIRGGDDPDDDDDENVGLPGWGNWTDNNNWN